MTATTENDGPDPESNSIALPRMTTRLWRRHGRIACHQPALRQNRAFARLRLFTVPGSQALEVRCSLTSSARREVLALYFEKSMPKSACFRALPIAHCKNRCYASRQLKTAH